MVCDPSGPRDPGGSPVSALGGGSRSGLAECFGSCACCCWSPWVLGGSSGGSWVGLVGPVIHGKFNKDFFVPKSAVQPKIIAEALLQN